MADDDVLLWPVRTAEFMHFDVTADVDPLADTVKVAIVPHRQGFTDADFTVFTATWVPGQTWTSKETPVRCRAWVPKNTLEVGKRYDTRVQVSDDPEVPEMDAGMVKGV